MIGPKYFGQLGRAEAAANGLAERLPNNFIDREGARKMTLICIRHVSCNQCVVAFLGLGKNTLGRVLVGRSVLNGRYVRVQVA